MGQTQRWDEFQNRKTCVWKGELEHQDRHGSQGRWVSHSQHYFEAFCKWHKEGKGQTNHEAPHEVMQVPLEDTKGELHTGSTQHTPCSR